MNRSASRIGIIMLGAASCLSACIAAPSYVDHSVVRVEMLPGGIRCKVHGNEMACSAVPVHLRSALGLAPGSPVGVVSIGQPLGHSLQALNEGLVAAGYVPRSPFLPAIRTSEQQGAAR